ncbi:MAG: alpha-ketoglutarate-dependent dioxygenase AlkB [Pseudomonadota bacterium]
MVSPLPRGVHYVPGFLDRSAQEDLRDALRAIAEEAPFFTPRMPRTGKPFSVRMTNCGPLGWVSDRSGGYRYQPTHPVTGSPWPAMPPAVLDAWVTLSGYDHPPEACLINYYAADARMGLHRDDDEDDFDAPVVSLSLGDTAIFRIALTDARTPTKSVRLHSGDALVMGGPARRAYHGIDRLLPDTSTLLKNGGRINLTLRRVTQPS